MGCTEACPAMIRSKGHQRDSMPYILISCSPLVSYALSTSLLYFVQLWIRQYSGGSTLTVLTVFFTEYAFRLWVVVALLVHEWSHIVAATFACGVLGMAGMIDASTALASARVALSPSNLRGNITLERWLLALKPAFLQPEALPHAAFVSWGPPLAAPRAARRAAAAFARVAGPVASAALAAAATSITVQLAAKAASSGPAAAAALCALPLAAASCLACCAVAAAAVSSDLLASGSGLIMRCGNFGCLLNLKDPRVAFTSDYGPFILQRMCAVTQVRGGQAAGIASMCSAAPEIDCPEGPLARGPSLVAHAGDAQRMEEGVRLPGMAPESASDEARRGPQSPTLCASFDRRAPAGDAQRDSISMAGGAAAPGLLTSVRRRLVNTKRGDMPLALRKLYTAAAGPGYPKDAAAAVYISHTRFATASLPAVMETHPHEWTPFSAEKGTCWAFRGGRFVLMPEATRGIHLTHNGDLDGVQLFRREIGTTELGLWLERVLHVPNSTRGDSPKAAGMSELICTQGHWGASVRWAYQETVALDPTDASGGVPLSKVAADTAPTAAWQAAWARVLDAATAQAEAQSLLARPLRPGAARFHSPACLAFVDAVIDRLRGMPPAEVAALGVLPSALLDMADAPVAVPETFTGLKPGASKLVKRFAGAGAGAEEAPKPRSGVGPMGVRPITAPMALRKFLKRAAESFLFNDVAESLKILLLRSTGSFGVTLLNALEPDTVAIAAFGQQMSVALHSHASMAIYGSEASAMKVAVKQPPGSSPDTWKFMTHRLDLDETHGEVVRLSLRPRPAVRSQRQVERLQELGGAEAPDLDASVHVAKQGPDVGRPNMWRRSDTRRSEAQSDAGAALDSRAGMVWNSLHINAYRFKLKRELAEKEIFERLVALQGNLLVQPLPLLSGPAVRDPVGADIEALPGVLKRVRDEWQSGDSLNRMTATAFSRMLLERMAHNAREGWGRDVDLLIVGCETSLWLGEQFASDVARAFPKIVVSSISANKLLTLFGSNQQESSVTGFCTQSSSYAALIRNAVVLIVTQSGQTFPVLHATRLLQHRLGNRIFVLTGEFDTKVGLVVGQNMAALDPFCARIFSNFSGWRPAEPTTVAAAAAHATLTELLLFMLHAFTVELNEDQQRRLLGIQMVRDDVRCLAEARDASTLEVIPMIALRSDGKSVVGLTAREALRAKLDDLANSGRVGGAHEALVEQGQAWATRVTETWHATVFSAFYVFGTIFFQFAPMNVLSVAANSGDHFWDICPLSAQKCVIGFVLRLVDVAIYIWIGWAFLLLRRYLRGDDVFARRGKRVLVIADVPWVHQSIEIYVSKLFALSYGDNGLDVHGANPLDSLVHRFTHRVQRGVLIALGRPDGRVASSARAESAVLLSAMQAAAIQNVGTGPEIMSVGHNPFVGNPGAIRNHIVLPTKRRPFMCEYVTAAKATDSGGDPSSILIKLAHGVVIPPELMKLTSSVAILCDRCARNHAVSECVQCTRKFCVACNLIVHLGGGNKSSAEGRRGHMILPVSVALRARMQAHRAQARVHARRSKRHAGLEGPLEDDVEDSGAADRAKMAALSSLGTEAGDTFPGFGVLAGSLQLHGHGRMLQLAGAPMGLHYARRLLGKVEGDRARRRWRHAIKVVLAQKNPWKRLLMDMEAKGMIEGEGGAAGHAEDAHTGPVIALETPVKDLCEGRFDSLHRYVSFLVMFHAMALRVSATSWPLPPFDISRSQSILRVASTAAPCSGAEVVHQLASPAAEARFTVRSRDSVREDSAQQGAARPRRASAAVAAEAAAEMAEEMGALAAPAALPNSEGNRI